MLLGSNSEIRKKVRNKETEKQGVGTVNTSREQFPGVVRREGELSVEKAGPPAPADQAPPRSRVQVWRRRVMEAGGERTPESATGHSRTRAAVCVCSAETGPGFLTAPVPGGMPRVQGPE